MGNDLGTRKQRSTGEIMRNIVLFIVGVIVVGYIAGGLLTKNSRTTQVVETVVVRITATPRPTSAPPTAASINNSRAAELEYLDMTTAYMVEINFAMEMLSSLFDEVSILPEVVLTTSWNDEVNGYLDDINFYCTRLKRLNAPSRLSAVHSKVSDACSHYIASTGLVRKFLDNPNENYSYGERASNEMTQANRAIVEATRLIEIAK